MTKIIKKKNVPLFFLLCISAMWSYFYTNDIWLNDYGSDKRELWLLIDCFFTLPLLCFYCYWDDKKTAVIKTVVYMSLLVLLGSILIPQVEKQVWIYLENIRYVAVAGFLLFEIVAVLTVVLAIKSAFERNQDPDDSIAQPLIKLMGGQSLLTSMMQVEARVWTFLLFAKQIKPENFTGAHFHSHLKDGVQSTLLGFIIITCIEIPILHTLLYFIWSPYAANVVSLLTLISLIYFIAQYRAIALRPISVTKDKVVIRYSLSNPLYISFSEVESVALNKHSVSRHKDTIRYNLFGVPNVLITLKKSKDRTFHKIYLGLNKPDKFVKLFNEQN